MITTITKRDGRTVHFDINKIASAIEKAFAATIGLALAQEVSDIFEEKQIDSPTVEQIQDTVERVLINHGHVRTAKAYILYRAERTRVRNMNDRLMKTFEDNSYKEAPDSDNKREHANIDGNNAMGSMLKYGSEGAKHFYESYVLNPAHSEAHRNGDIHIHDLDFYTLTTTCCQIDLIKLFHDGFSTGHGVLREPNDIASYASLACIAIQSNQNDQHGGQSIANFDYGLAPGVAKTYKKRYRSNLTSLIEVMDCAAHAKKTKEIFQTLTAENLIPTLDGSQAYTEREKELLLEAGVPEEILDKIQSFSAKKATEETDKATYPAMEALLHNLNTMHSLSLIHI